MSARPAHRSIRVGEDGTAWVEAYRCTACGAVVAEATLACRSCVRREPPVAFRSSEQGSLYSWTVVERSYPGIEVPFVSAIVDLEDGLTLKGTLRGVEPRSVSAGQRVEIRFDDAGGARDKSGNGFVGFHFIRVDGGAS